MRSVLQGGRCGTPQGMGGTMTKPTPPSTPPSTAQVLSSCHFAASSGHAVHHGGQITWVCCSDLSHSMRSPGGLLTHRMPPTTLPSTAQELPGPCDCCGTPLACAQSC